MMGTSLAMSIMFPTIFALGIRGWARLPALGASFIIMAIVSAAIATPLVGLLAGALGSLKLAMAVPLLCFGAVAIYARGVAEGKHPVNLNFRPFD
jgi:FHS family L-fucose permease-like MFS transporter